MELINSKHPMRVIMYAPSGSGKSSTLKYIMTDDVFRSWRLQWNTIICIGHTLPEKHYSWADFLIEGKASDTFDAVVTIVDNQCKQWKSGDERKLLLIFEDLIGTGFQPFSKVHKEFFASLCTTYRNCGVSYFIIVQEIKSGAMTPTMRDNSTHLLMCAPAKRREVNEALAQLVSKDTQTFREQTKRYLTRPGLTAIFSLGAFRRNMTVMETPAHYAISS